jgi:hypothetical protein
MERGILALLSCALPIFAGCSSFARYDAAALDRDSALDIAGDRDSALDITGERDIATVPDGADAADATDVAALSDTFDAAASDAGADANLDGVPVACGATDCSIASTAPCDLADGIVHEMTIGTAPDPFPFGCATFTPGAAAVRLTLAVARTVYLDLTTPLGSSAALQVYRTATCTTGAVVANSCITTTGTARDDLGVLPSGTYFVVVKSTGRPTVQLHAVLM